MNDYYNMAEITVLQFDISAKYRPNLQIQLKHHTSHNNTSICACFIIDELTMVKIYHNANDLESAEIDIVYIILQNGEINELLFINHEIIMYKWTAENKQTVRIKHIGMAGCNKFYNSNNKIAIIQSRSGHISHIHIDEKHTGMIKLDDHIIKYDALMYLSDDYILSIYRPNLIQHFQLTLNGTDYIGRLIETTLVTLDGENLSYSNGYIFNQDDKIVYSFWPDTLIKPGGRS